VGVSTNSSARDGTIGDNDKDSNRKLFTVFGAPDPVANLEALKRGYIYSA